MKKAIFFLMIIVILLSACGSKDGPVQEQTAEVTLNDVLNALNEAGIRYVERAETQSVYDFSREGAERFLYGLEPGNMTVYMFSSIEQRREIQRDPFPTADVVPPNGSYGIGRMLVFYYDGVTSVANKLMEAFGPLGVEQKNQLE